jgi:hypothetical protein
MGTVVLLFCQSAKRVRHRRQLGRVVKVGVVFWMLIEIRMDGLFELGRFDIILGNPS